MDTWVHCPRKAESDVPTSLAQVHPLASLFYCGRCHHVLNPDWCPFTVESKHCPQCRHQYEDGSRCSRNCFECPQCCTTLAISINDIDGGKQFVFKCNGCEYHFSTGVISKPRSLHSILKHEIGENWVAYYASLRHQLMNPERAPVDSRMEANLKLSGLSKQKGAVRLESSRMPKIPQGRQLVGKLAYRCPYCKGPLLVPSADVKSPLQRKYVIKSNAVDYLPQFSAKVSVMNGNVIPVVLSVVSPVATEITLSAPTLVPSQLTRGATVGIRLPHPSFTVGPSDLEDAKHQFVKTIPTVCLTDFSPVARAELVLRRGTAPKFPPSIETYVEQGHFWTSVGLELTVEGGSVQDSTIPLFVRLPHLSYWTMLKLSID